MTTPITQSHILAAAVQLADYTDLRAYAGSRKSVYVTGYLSGAAPSGIAGLFVRDDHDTTTPDDNLNCIVAAGGVRFKRQVDGSLQASGGASLIGYILSATGAVKLTLQDKLHEHISVWDFMSDAMRADALSGSPLLDHAPAWNAAIASLNGAGVVRVPRLGSAVYLLKSTVSLGTSNTVDSSVVIDIDPGTKVLATLPNITDVLFNIKNVPGHFNNQGIKNLHAYSTNGNGVCMKFNGQCYGSFENNYMENFNVGRWFSNEGSGIFNEFIRFTNTETHLCNTAVLMSKDGDVVGTDTSMHGISDRASTINVGSGQVGLQTIDVCWYNANFDLKFFSQSSSQAIIKMSTSGTVTNKGVFGSGSVTCEGPAKLIGTGRFYFKGNANFDVGVTDTLSSPDSWEQGFMCDNYIKALDYGTSGFTVAEVNAKSSEYGTTGPIGSFARMRKANVESLIAVSYSAHASNAGNGFFTGYTGFHQNYDTGGILGWFLASDGTEIRSYAPNGTIISVFHGADSNPYGDNQCFAIRDGKFYIGSANLAAGSGSPVGSWNGNQGDFYLNRSGGSGSTLWVNERGGDTGWARVFTGKLSLQSDSTAPDVATLKADFNALLSKLRSAGLM